MFKNVIFDFGQVMIRFDGDIMTAPYAEGEDLAVVRDVVFDRKYFDALDIGELSDEEAKADFRHRLPRRPLHASRLFWQPLPAERRSKNTERGEKLHPPRIHPPVSARPA